MSRYCFNILTFNHPQDELTFYFSKDEQSELFRVNHRNIPDEVIEKFGPQENYYTSFDKPVEAAFPVTKPVKPNYQTQQNQSGEKQTRRIKNSTFSYSLIKSYYNTKINQYFKSQGFLVKSNFIYDTEVWMPSDQSDPTGKYTLYDRFSLKVQIKTITDKLELLVTYTGVPKVFKKSIEQLLRNVSPKDFTWCVFENNLYRYDKLPDKARRAYNQVYPAWNFTIHNALGLKMDAPDRSNKYIKFKQAIDTLYQEHLNTEEFKEIIHLDSNGFIPIEENKISSVKKNSNKLLFGNGQTDIVPYNGIKNHGPYEFSDNSKIHFFYIFHKNDTSVAKKIDSYFRGEENGFPGLLRFIHTPYYTERGFSIIFDDIDDPWLTIYHKITDKHFEPDVRYLAIYISPYPKDTPDKDKRKLYFKVKELLLKKGISSQVIEAQKVRRNNRYHLSLPNIAIAILAKLNGIPWRLDTELKNELVVGVGAFKNIEFGVQYIGSALSFSNNGKFNRFISFHNYQVR